MIYKNLRKNEKTLGESKVDFKDKFKKLIHKKLEHTLIDHVECDRIEMNQSLQLKLDKL